MSVRYYTLVAHEMLKQIRDGSAVMPDGFRFIRVVEAPTPDPWCELVEFEDDHAPADLDRCRVLPYFVEEWLDGKRTVRISERHVEQRP